MTAEEIHKVLADKFGDQVGPLQAGKRDPFCVVKAEGLLEICSFLKHDPALSFDSLMNLSAVEPFKSKTALLVVYHLYSYQKRHVFILKVELDRASPNVASLQPIWKVADWFEREQYDLLGVNFVGHPDLRRIMLPDDWVGHPLRKDYKEPLEYHQISHLRESPLDGFVRLDEQAKKLAAEKSAAAAALTEGEPKKELLQ